MGRNALRILRIHGTEVRTKRPMGVQVSPLNPLPVFPCVALLVVGARVVVLLRVRAVVHVVRRGLHARPVAGAARLVPQPVPFTAKYSERYGL